MAKMNAEEMRAAELGAEWGLSFKVPPQLKKVRRKAERSTREPDWKRDRMSLRGH